MASSDFWCFHDSGGGENDTMILVFLIAVAAGIISGMGIGGGTILIPALIFIEGLNQHQAQGVNLIYFIPTAMIALITHSKNKNIETKIVLPIVLTGLLGAAAGALIAVRLDASLLKKLFGGFLLIMGLTEIFKK